jgi:hypothetical protein
MMNRQDWLLLSSTFLTGTLICLAALLSSQLKDIPLFVCNYTYETWGFVPVRSQEHNHSPFRKRVPLGLNDANPVTFNVHQAHLVLLLTMDKRNYCPCIVEAPIVLASGSFALRSVCPGQVLNMVTMLEEQAMTTGCTADCK